MPGLESTGVLGEERWLESLNPRVDSDKAGNISYILSGGIFSNTSEYFSMVNLLLPLTPPKDLPRNDDSSYDLFCH